MSDPRYKTQRWLRLRRYVIRRDGRRCAEPGCLNQMLTPHMTHVDHIVEVADGVDFWDPRNLRVVCKYHHFAKTLTVAAGRGEPVSPNA